jgi:hypothetical protein
MNRRHDDSAGVLPPTAMRAGKDRLVRQYTVDRARGRNDGHRVEPAAFATNQRCVTSITALDQPAQITERLVQIGVSAQAAQPQSP